MNSILEEKQCRAAIRAKLSSIVSLEERIHLVLAEARKEDASFGKDPTEDDSTMAHAQSHCFHFMELQGVLKGKPGVYKQVLK